MASIYASLLEQKDAFAWEKSLTLTELIWDTNMAAVSLFWDTNMAAMTSRENTLLAKCEAINMKMILYSHANKTHFHSFCN